MNILGIDYGHKRVGLAYGDSQLKVSVPIPAAVESTFEARLEHIAREIKQRRIEKIVIGYPYNMDGSVGGKAREVDEYIKVLEERFGLPVVRFDERLSSSQAKRSLREKGYDEKSMRGKVDMIAASLFLQAWLEREG